MTTNSKTFSIAAAAVMTLFSAGSVMAAGGTFDALYVDAGPGANRAISAERVYRDKTPGNGVEWASVEWDASGLQPGDQVELIVYLPEGGQFVGHYEAVTDSPVDLTQFGEVDGVGLAISTSTYEGTRQVWLEEITDTAADVWTFGTPPAPEEGADYDRDLLEFLTTPPAVTFPPAPTLSPGSGYTAPPADAGALPVPTMPAKGPALDTSVPTLTQPAPVAAPPALPSVPAADDSPFFTTAGAPIDPVPVLTPAEPLTADPVLVVDDVYAAEPALTPAPTLTPAGTLTPDPALTPAGALTPDPALTPAGALTPDPALTPEEPLSPDPPAGGGTE